VTDTVCPSVWLAVTSMVCEPTVPASGAPEATAEPPSIDALHPLSPDANVPPAPALQLNDAFGTDPYAYDALSGGVVIDTDGGCDVTV
jgi:hypothetical protein